MFHVHQKEAKTDDRNMQESSGSKAGLTPMVGGRVLEPLHCMAGYTPG